MVMEIDLRRLEPLRPLNSGKPVDQPPSDEDAVLAVVMIGK